MAYSASLDLTLSCKDQRVREVGPPPILQTYAPSVAESNRKVTLPATTWTQIDLPTGTALLWLNLADCFNLRIDWQEGADDTEGFPLCPTDSANNLPALIPLGDDASVWVYNSEATEQVLFASFF